MSGTLMDRHSSDVPNDELCRRVASLEASLQVDKIRQNEIEKGTRGQANNPRWFQERRRRVTASLAGRINSLKSTTDNTGLLSYMLEHDKSSFKTAATVHGSEHEMVAREAYGKLTNVIVRESGLVVSLENGILAASPDGFIGEEGLLEIKCPFTIRFEDPKTWTKSPSPLTRNAEGEPTLRIGHHHYLQVVMQIHVTGRAWCDYFIWTTAGHFLQRITKAETIDTWNKLKEKLESFWRIEIAPEIVDSRFARGIMEYRCPPSRLAARSRKLAAATTGPHNNARRSNSTGKGPRKVGQVVNNKSVLRFGKVNTCPKCGNGFYSKALFRIHSQMCQ